MRRRIPLFLFPVALVASSFLLFGLLLYRLFSSESSVWTPFCGNEDIEGGGNTMPNQLTSGRRTYKRSVVEVAYTSFYSILNRIVFFFYVILNPNMFCIIVFYSLAYNFVMLYSAVFHSTRPILFHYVPLSYSIQLCSIQLCSIPLCPSIMVNFIVFKSIMAYSTVFYLTVLKIV